MSKFHIDRDRVSETLDTIVKEIHENEDPVELDTYRKLFKRHVSVFKRAYVAAYMLKYFKRRSQRRAYSDMESLYMGVGRTRRVFPRDVIGLILDKTDLLRDDIGNIKILDNYSFIDVNSSKAEAVIQALNGMEYRGRTLTVSHAKKKSYAAEMQSRQKWGTPRETVPDSNQSRQTNRH